MSPQDRERVEALLAEPDVSYREIARQTGLSDWTVRKISRDLNGDPRPMKRSPQFANDPLSDGDDVSPTVACIVFGGFVVILALVVWAAVRWQPFPDSSNFYSTSNPEQDRSKET